MLRIILTLLVIFSFATKVQADDVYQSPEEFIKQAFGGATPPVKTLQLPTNFNSEINKIMDRQYDLGKPKYWEKDGRTAWILEEIGKVKPITTGVVISDDKIERLKVLIYRESHGWEVKHDFFTDQFKGLGLKDSGKLTGYIDNVSGATMSVDALRNIGELALFLHKNRNK